MTQVNLVLVLSSASIIRIPFVLVLPKAIPLVSILCTLRIECRSSSFELNKPLFIVDNAVTLHSKSGSLTITRFSDDRLSRTRNSDNVLRFRTVRHWTTP